MHVFRIDALPRPLLRNIFTVSALLHSPATLKTTPKRVPTMASAENTPNRL
jgi:hypothetical protein